MRKFLILFIVLVLLLASVGGYFAYQKYFVPKPKHVHYHAGFMVYEDDKFVDFSQDRYMHEKPCTLEPDTEDENDPMEIVHLHERVGTVAHVHRENATWGRLFQNLNYTISGNVEAYSNGKKVEDILDQPIKPYESVVILIGTNTKKDAYLKKAMTVPQIKKLESTSEQCGS